MDYRKYLVGLSVMLYGCTSAQNLTNNGVEKTTIQSLSNAYKEYFPIGTAIAIEDLNDNAKTTLITNQFNSITPENQMKPRYLHPKENVFKWEDADKMVAFARENKMKVRGHTLVWYQNIPDWFVKNADGSLITKEELFKKMEAHINAVVGRYKNDVYCWDVVNEAISDKPEELYRENDLLYKIAGEEYIEKAFYYTRKADPTAKLYYNDYRFSNPLKRKKILDLLKRLKDKGIAVDGIGLQEHLIPNELTATYLQETIDMFKGIGLQIQITELDISIYDYRNKAGKEASKEDTFYTEERKQVQMNNYLEIFDVVRKNKDVVTGVTFWGFADARKNFRTNRIGKMDYPFLFDEFLQPKEVFYKLINYKK